VRQWELRLAERWGSTSSAGFPARPSADTFTEGANHQPQAAEATMQNLISLMLAESSGLKERLLDPSKCPECEAPTHPLDLVAGGAAQCRGCGLWKLITGGCTLPVASNDEPPIQLRLHRPYWDRVPANQQPREADRKQQFKPRRSRGHPELKDADRKKMIKDYTHYKASDLTQKEYLKERGNFRGMNEKESLAYLDACRKHWKKANPGI
jgi:hypothetical protein